MSRCPDENQIVAFIHGRLAPAAAHAVEQHVDRCSACAALIEGLAEMGTASRTTDPQPARSGYRAPALAGRSVGRYVIERKLGEGAMGVVFAALDPTLGRRVALKAIRPELCAGEGAEQANARLLREARAMAALSHPNVVAVYDAGSLGDEVFLAMELVDGVTLADWLRAAPRSPQEILAAFRSAGLGLAAAHEAGVLHRDFKPANVLVGNDGRVRVTDFGLSRPPLSDAAAPAGSPIDVARTVAGALVGTPAYMAPEQLFLRPVDARADQFGFCVALYEALYGAPPFGGSTLAERRWNVAATPPAWPRDHRGAPHGVAAVLLRGLAARPEDRHPSMRALLDALDAAATKADGIHVAANAAIQALAGVVHVVIAALWFAATLQSGHASSSPVDSAEASDYGILGQVAFGFLMVVLLVMLLWVPLGIVWAPLNAFGLARRRAWARRSSMIYAAIALLSCVGLPYGIYAIWSLRRPGVRALFAR